MIPRDRTTAVASGAASGDDVKRILGDMDASKVIEILALEPPLAEIEGAAMWTSGNGDVLAKGGHPQTGMVARIIDILTFDEEEAESR